MELSFLDLKEREIINVFDGKKLGRIIDIVFNNESGKVRGIVVPGDKKLFRKDEDIFIPIEKIKRIGNDVILVGVQFEDHFVKSRAKKDTDKNIRIYENYYNRNYNSYSPGRTQNNSYSDNNAYPRGNQYADFGKNAQNFNQNDINMPRNLQNSNNYQKSFVRLKPIDRKKYK